MSKKLRLYSLLSLLGIYAVLNVIIFLVLFNQEVNNPTFWVAWGFGFPGSYLLSLFIVEFTSRGKRFEDITTVPSLITTLCFDLLFVIASFVFIFLPNVSYKISLIVDLVLLVLFGIIQTIFLIGMNYINNNDKKQKAKVFYIRDLASDVENIKLNTTNEKLKSSLNKLAEDIRFSDPMSDESLARVEEEIQELVFRLKEYVESNKVEDANNTINDIGMKLRYRNEKCINLK